MITPKLDELFQPEKHTWVMAYRHSAKYFGRLIDIDGAKPPEGKTNVFAIRKARNVALSPIFQLITAQRQVHLDAQGKPVRFDEAGRPMSKPVSTGITTEPFVQLVEFCDYMTPMHFEGADIQRFFSEMTKDDVKGYRELLEGVVNAVQAASPITLATPAETQQVVRGR
jgi:hypothetical protein